MLRLVTGQPGNFKTARTLWEVEQLRRESGREVYCSGIPELTLPWHRFEDPARWPELPDGSIVVIDEAQRSFRVRAQGARVPDHVAALETHRHRGFDLYLVTQHPHLIDTAVRKLCGEHVHMVRRFGLERATMYRWEEVADPTSESEKKLATSSTWSPPREVYGWYKSATLHTVKRNLPIKRFVQAAAALLVVVVSVGFAARHVLHLGDSVESLELPSAVESGRADTARGISGARDPGELGPWDPSMRAARLEGLARTAAFYDALQVVKSQPKVSGCMRLDVGTRIQCRCSTAQGSDAHVSTALCVQLVKEGWFDETRPEVDERAKMIARLDARDAANSGGGAQAATAQPATPAASVLSSSQAGT
ncbi:MAG: zonular occludens toxin domain-containing protein [Steroidobacteraceae bacterium]